jgi:hypothetical protein
MKREMSTAASAAKNGLRMQRLRGLVARRARSDWGKSHIEETLAQDPRSPHARCPRYAGILGESGEESVILAETVQQLAREMGSLADAEIPILPVELIDLDTGEQRLAHRHTTVGFVGSPVERPHAAASRSPTTAATQQEKITIDRERLAELEGVLAGVDEHSLTRGEDARHLLSEAIQRGALNIPDGLAVLVESDEDEEDCWVRLILTTDRPASLEYSTGWAQVMGALTRGIAGALEYAAGELNDILQLVDPREPSTREAILRAMRSVSKGGEVPPADLHMELAARYQISDEDLD